MHTDCHQLFFLTKVYLQFQLWLEQWTFPYEIQIDILEIGSKLFGNQFFKYLCKG